MSLSETKIRVIQDFVTAMQKAQGELRDAPDRDQKTGPAFMEMMSARISDEDLREFNTRFPETPIGISGPGIKTDADLEIKEAEGELTHEQVMQVVRREAENSTAELIHTHEKGEMYLLSDGRLLFVRKDGWGYTSKQDLSGIHLVEREFGPG